MRLTRWARALHGHLHNWAGRTRWASHQGRFIYRREGREYPVTYDGRNHQFHAIYDNVYRCGYEPETSRLVSLLLPHVHGSFFDIGANWGYYSLLAAAVPGFGGEIFPFEPNPRVFADLKSIIDQTALTGRVHPQAAGVGDKEGELRVEEPDLFQTGIAKLVHDGDGIRVPVRRLDACNLPSPGFIKIDAEGMEMAILTGAREILTTSRPSLVFESFLDAQRPEHTQQPMELLESLGYRCFLPVLMFERAGRISLTVYGENVSQLLAEQPGARSGLVRIGPVTRFLSRPHINVFACHESQIQSIWAAGVINLDALPGLYRPAVPPPA